MRRDLAKAIAARFDDAMATLLPSFSLKSGGYRFKADRLYHELLTNKAVIFILLGFHPGRNLFYVEVAWNDLCEYPESPFSVFPQEGLRLQRGSIRLTELAGRRDMGGVWDLDNSPSQAQHPLDTALAGILADMQHRPTIEAADQCATQAIGYLSRFGIPYLSEIRANLMRATSNSDGV